MRSSADDHLHTGREVRTQGVLDLGDEDGAAAAEDRAGAPQDGEPSVRQRFRDVSDTGPAVRHDGDRAARRVDQGPRDVGGRDLQERAAHADVGAGERGEALRVRRTRCVAGDPDEGQFRGAVVLHHPPPAPEGPAPHAGVEPGPADDGRPHVRVLVTVQDGGEHRGDDVEDRAAGRWQALPRPSGAGADAQRVPPGVQRQRRRRGSRGADDVVRAQLQEVGEGPDGRRPGRRGPHDGPGAGGAARRAEDDVAGPDVTGVGGPADGAEQLLTAGGVEHEDGWVVRVGGGRDQRGRQVRPVRAQDDEVARHLRRRWSYGGGAGAGVLDGRGAHRSRRRP